VYSNSLFSFYGYMFWPTQIFAGVLLYFFEEYNESGYFSVSHRIFDAFRNIGQFLLLCLVVGGVALGVLLGGGYVSDEKALLVTAVAATNTYGLVVIIFLLGYGLVELPKVMWMNGNLQGKLRRLRGRAAHEFRALADASMDMSEGVAHSLKTKAEVEKQAALSAGGSAGKESGLTKLKTAVFGKSKEDPAIAAAKIAALAAADKELLEKCLPKLMKECPLDEFTSTHGGTIARDKSTGRVSKDSLAALRKTVKKRKAKYVMCQSRVERLKREVFALEDIVAAKHRADKVLRIQYANGGESRVTSFLYQCYIRPVAGRFLALVVIAMCCSVVLAEVGLMAGQASPVAVLSRGNHDPEMPPSDLIVLNLFYIAFIAYVILFALSQLRLADIMEIAPEQKTTPKSLSYNARLSCKLAPPLAYNFLTLCFESGVETGAWMKSALTGEEVKTAFSRFYGSMDIIPFLGNNFNRIFPVFVLVLACLQVFNAYNRVLGFLHLDFLLFGDPPVSKKDMEEGLIKLQKYRQQMQASVAREERMRKMSKTGKREVGKVIPAEGGGEEEEEDGDDEVLGGWGGGGRDGRRWDPARGPPAVKEGWLEKKTGREASGGGWQARYFVLGGGREGGGFLVHYKKQDKVGSTLGTLDMAKVLTISNQVGGKEGGKEGGMADATRLNIETAEGKMKLRCRSEDLAGEWRRALYEWREYALALKMGAPSPFAPALPSSFPAPAPPAFGGGGGGKGGREEGREGMSTSLLPANVPSSSSSSSSAAATASNLMARLGAAATAAATTAAGKMEGGGGLFASSPTPLAPGVGGPGATVVERGGMGKKMPVMPRPLGGKLGLLGGVFGVYSDKYFLVKTTDGTLKWYAGGGVGREGGREGGTGPPQGSMDMRGVEKVCYEEPKGGGKRDPSKFVVFCVGGGGRMGGAGTKEREPALRLKAESPAEAEMWINGLMEWSAYFKAMGGAGKGAGASAVSPRARPR